MLTTLSVEKFWRRSVDTLPFFQQVTSSTTMCQIQRSCWYQSRAYGELLRISGWNLPHKN